MADPVEVPKSVWELIVEAAPASEHPEVCENMWAEWNESLIFNRSDILRCDPPFVPDC